MSDVAAGRWQQVRSLFDRAAELPPDAWEAMLANECGDPSLRKEVLTLLAAMGRGDASFEQGARAVVFTEESDGAGRTVGPYRLVGRIGHGGMGAVYEAVRADQTFEKRVAIKFIRPGMGAGAMLDRFRRERQILAALEHPNVARLLDGGATADGQPYLVMEYIQGEPIDLYSDRKELDIGARLELFLQLCDAVQYAHQNLIIHRDIKPQNVLVTSGGTVKLLDFGVAKLLLEDDRDGAAGGTTTVAGAFALTPEYASPEQLRGDPLSLGSDVYSLGIVLFQLLAGRRPFISETRSPLAALEVRGRTLPKPSAVARAEATRSGADMSMRTHLRTHRRLLGELDNIILKSLRVEPARRYTSVEQFAEDIRRYMSGRPVGAQPDSRRYRARKFVGRHRGSVVAASVAVVMLTGGAGLALWQARRADMERVKAERINGFLQNMLSAPDSRWFASARRPRAQVMVSEVLDDASERAGVDLESEPAVEAAVRHTLGRTYSVLSRYDQADAELTRALALDRILGARPIPNLAADMHDLGMARLGRGDSRGADSLFRGALDLCHRYGEAADTAHVCGHSVNDLGLALWAEDDLSGAERQFQQALSLARRLYGPWHPANAVVLGNLGGVRDGMGDLAGAERFYREALDVYAHNNGREFPERALTLGNLGGALAVEGRYGEAEAALTTGLDVFARTLGPLDPSAGATWTYMADLHLRTGEIARAMADITRSLDILNAKLAPTHRFVTAAKVQRGHILTASGRAVEGERQLREVLAAAHAAPGSRKLAEIQSALGEALLAQHRPGEALPLLRASHAAFRRAYGSRHPQTLEVQRQLAMAEQATALAASSTR